MHCDVTAVFPWLTYALLSEPKTQKKHRRLYDSRVKALANLQKQVDKRKKELLETTSFPMPETQKKPSAKDAKEKSKGRA